MIQFPNPEWVACL